MLISFNLRFLSFIIIAFLYRVSSFYTGISQGLNEQFKVFTLAEGKVSLVRPTLDQCELYVAIDIK